MFEISLICVGSLRESYWRDAFEEYRRRLTGRCRIDVHEIPEFRLPPDPSPAQIDAGLAREARRILPLMEHYTFRVALCVEGERLSSEALARRFSVRMANGASAAAFVVGGSYGLSEEVKQRVSLRLSMSDMTFPHQLARIVLCEQIYRAFSILDGGKYNK